MKLKCTSWLFIINHTLFFTTESVNVEVIHSGHTYTGNGGGVQSFHMTLQMKTREIRPRE